MGYEIMIDEDTLVVYVDSSDQNRASGVVLFVSEGLGLVFQLGFKLARKGDTWLIVSDSSDNGEKMIFSGENGEKTTYKRRTFKSRLMLPGYVSIIEGIINSHAFSGFRESTNKGAATTTTAPAPKGVDVF